MRQLVFFFALVCCSSSFSQTIETLKSTPATKYDIGLVRLDMVVFALSERFGGNEVADTSFEISGFRYEERDGKLFFVQVLEGRARDMSDEMCSRLNNRPGQRELLDSISRDLWPDLDEDLYLLLSGEFLGATEIVSEENSNFKISC